MVDWPPIVAVAGGLVSVALGLITIFMLIRKGGSNSTEMLLTGYANRVKELEIDNERYQARVTTLEARVVGLERVLDTKEIDRQREVQALYRQNDELRQEIKECRREIDDLKHRPPRRREDPPDTDFAGGKT